MKIDGRFLFLALCMVFTGTVNTLTTKFADLQSSKGIDGKVRSFDHPFFQAVGMFLGEFMCLWVFYLLRLNEHCQGKEMQKSGKPFNPFIFVLPACCDMTATSLMYLGLTWTYASVFQMLRGSVVIFTGILSLVFLKRKLYAFHWLGMMLVLAGLSFVGFASILSGGSSASAPRPLLGDIVIICAQLIVAIQMVIEEKFISQYDIPPLQVVGFEGIFGFSILSCLLVVFYYIPGSSAGNHFENSPDALVQISNSYILLLAVLGNIFSIAFFNYFGISITAYSSATTRMVLDSVRTVLIWGFSLLVGWQSFQYLQVIGFTLLLTGTCIYNEILILPFDYMKKPVDPEEIEKQRLIQDQE